MSYSKLPTQWDSKIPPAPGALRIVQAFVNTFDVETQDDALETVDGLAGWLSHWDLLHGEALITDAERREAVDLREGLRQLILANNGQPTDPTSLNRLQRALGDLPLRCSLDETGSFELVGVSSGWPRAAARLLTLVTRAMSDGSWQRLKACRRHECRWAFYDTSKNRSGKWCRMAGCGDLMKARAYRERLRARSRRRGRADPL